MSKSVPNVVGRVVLLSVGFVVGGIITYKIVEGLFGLAIVASYLLTVAEGRQGGEYVYFSGVAGMAGYLVYMGLRFLWQAVAQTTHGGPLGGRFMVLGFFAIMMPFLLIVLGVGSIAWPITVFLLWRDRRREQDRAKRATQREKEHHTLAPP